MRSKLWTKISGLFVFAGVALGCATGAVMNNDMHKVSAEETKTATLTVSSYASANSWSNGVQYLTATVDDVTFTANGGGNTGKYYNSGTNWRFYQTENATLTITVDGGVISTVTPTYTIDKGGVATFDSKNVTSGTTVTVNAAEAIFGVANTGTATNGQVKYTKIVVEYTKSGESTPDPVLQSINLTVDGSYKDSYTTLEKWSEDGLTTTAIYDTKTETVTATYTFKPDKPAVGVTSVEITATYKGFTSTKSVDVTVTEPVIEEAGTVTLNVKEYAEANDWADATQYLEASVLPVTFTAYTEGTVNGGFKNTGKYYANGNNWRFYQNETNAKLTISIPNGNISSVKLEYAIKNTGVAVYNGVNVPSGTEFDTTGTSVEIRIGNTGEATNGNIQFTKIHVTYDLNGVVVPQPEVKSIELTVGGEYKTAYELCETWSQEDLTTVATFDDETSGEVLAVYSFIPAAPALGTESVEITATYYDSTSDKTFTSTKTVDVTVTEPESITCAVAKTTLEKGNKAIVKGVVASFYQGTQFLLVDQATSEGIFIYTSTDFGLAIGDEVVVSGEYDLYNNLTQLKNVIVAKLASGKTVTPRVVDALTETDFAQHIADYVTVKNMKFVKDEVSETSSSSLTIDTSAQGFKIYSHKNDKAARSVWNNAFANYKDLESTVVFDITGIMGAYTTPQMYLTSDTVIDVNEYATFINYMNETVKDVCATNPETVTGETWTTAETLFGYLSAAEKAAFKALAADQAGTAEQQAAARYDQIVAKRAGKDFAGRDTGVTSNRVTSILNNNNNNLVLIIVIASSLVAVAAIAFIYYRKRQLNK